MIEGCPKIILASRSPRRIFLFLKLGLNFIISPPTFETEVITDDPIESVRLNALEKARSVSRLFLEGYVVAADTVVVVEGRILGKPKSLDEARNFYKLLSGKKHRVITGIAVIDASSNRSVVDVAITEVEFKDLSDNEIDLLVKLDDPLDKAGAYAAQGLASLVIKSINGDFWNVVGFPLNLFYEIMRNYFEVDIIRCLKPKIDLIL